MNTPIDFAKELQIHEIARILRTMHADDLFLVAALLEWRQATVLQLGGFQVGGIKGDAAHLPAGNQRQG